MRFFLTLALSPLCAHVVAENSETLEHPLHEAAKRGNLPFMEELVLSGMTVNDVDNAGNTPLHWAARCVRPPSPDA